MRFDKIALEKVAQHVETELELDPRDTEQALTVRENITDILTLYFQNTKSETPSDTLESLTVARESLYQIYLAAGRAIQAVSLSTSPANKELADTFTAALRIMRVQAEAVFNTSN